MDMGAKIDGEGQSLADRGQGSGIGGQRAVYGDQRSEIRGWGLTPDF